MNTQDLAHDTNEIKLNNKSSTREGELWYKRYPHLFAKATEDMPFDLRTAYSFFLDYYYYRGGPLPDDDIRIARWLGCDVRKWKHIRRGLFEHGKLHLGPDGLIHNEKANELLTERQDKLAKKRVRPIRRVLGKTTTPVSTSVSTPASTTPSTSVSTTPDLLPISNEINVHAPENVSYARATKSEEVRVKIKSSTSKEVLVAGATPLSSPDVDALQAFNDYNATAEKVGLAKAALLNPQRRKSLKARLRGYGGLEGWRAMLVKVEASDFLCGRKDGSWRAGLDFLIKASTFTKVVEGTYDNRSTEAGASPSRRLSRAEEFQKRAFGG